MGQGGSGSILVVDDDSATSKLLEVILDTGGYTVRRASSGEEALAIMLQQTPDLVLLDILMPGIDGIELTQQLKADPLTRSIPIILVTTLEDSLSRLRGLEAGADDFLTKPVNRAELLVRVKNLLMVKAHQDRLADYNRRLEEQVRLRTEELRIAAIAFETQEGIVITDQNGLILRVNSAFMRLSGFSSEEICGRTPDILKSGGKDEEYRAIWQALLRDAHWRGEIQGRCRDGSVYPSWLTITAVSDEQGQVTHYVATFFDLSSQKQAEEMRQLALYDPLTGLPNRRLLLDRLKQVVLAGERSGHFGSLMFMDLDNFKALNDQYGHHVGDQLLIEVASRLTKCKRSTNSSLFSSPFGWLNPWHANSMATELQFLQPS